MATEHFESGVQACTASWRKKMEELPQGYGFRIVARFDIPESETADDYLPRLMPFFDDVEKTGEYRALWFRPNQHSALDRNKNEVGELSQLGVDAALLGWSKRDLKMLLASARFVEEPLEEDFVMGRGDPESVARIGRSCWHSFAVGVLRLARGA